MRINIHFKITIIFGAVIAALLFGIYRYLDNTLTGNSYRNIKANLEKETFFAAAMAAKQIPRAEDMDTIADEIGGNLGLRATIISSDGKVLGDSELGNESLKTVENHLYRPEIQAALKGATGESVRFSTTVKMNMLYIARPFGKPQPVGVVRLSVPLSDIDQVSERLKKMLVAAFLAAFALAMGACFIVSLFISKPLRKISLAAKDMALGSFSEKLQENGNDELGDLARAFNHMSEEVRARMDEILSNRSRLEAVLFSMFDGVMVVDSNGLIVLMNKALKDILHVKKIEPYKQKPIEVIRNVEIQEITDRALRLEKGVITSEISLLFPEERTLLAHTTPVTRGEKTEGAVLVFHDITELKKLEKIRKDFVANVSHELRTPISSIKGYAETLLDGALEEKENAREFVQIMHANSERLAKLVEDILDLSRIESGKLDIKLKSCDAMIVTERVLTGFKKAVFDKKITVRNHIPVNAPRILADENRLAQVLLNLIDNAVKYTPERGEITISSEDKDGFLLINVSDTGPGIPERDIPRIFERFYMVDKARSRELGGTGLGLSIVKHIVQAHGGEVSVESDEGLGSTFSFTIPKA